MTNEDVRQAYDEAMSSIPHGHQVAIARYVVSLKDKLAAVAEEDAPATQADWEALRANQNFDWRIWEPIAKARGWTPS